MASRPIVPQQARGEAVVGAGKQKKVVGMEGRNKRAPLNDIGNVVTIRGPDGKPQTQLSRPITRSFGAQLLANAQASAAGKNKKEDEAPNLEAQSAKKAVEVQKQLAQKKVVSKPKREEVIEISPDTEEKMDQKRPENQKNSSSTERGRKKVPTMTSILTARSKVACGLADKKLKDPIIDIDAADAGNELAVAEYVGDIYKFYKLIENETRVHDYMELQPDINERMRAILIDWLIEVHNRFELMPETLYLTINLVDRFLAVKMVPRKELQLVGIGAMLIACKYEEIWAPEVNDLVCISDRVFSNEQILKMEKTILGKLEWSLTLPTPYVFLVRFIKASIPDEETENLVHFLAELALMQYATIVFCPSMIAASAVYVARHTLNKSPVWTETLKLHTGFSESQLIECAKMLAGFHSTAAESKLQVVYRKYSKPEKGAVALLSPAKALAAAAAASS